MADQSCHSAGHAAAISRNLLLSGLRADDRTRIAPHLQFTTLRLGDVLYVPDGAPAFAYFPVTAVVSLHYELACGAAIEMAAVGHDGMVGMALYLGGVTTPSWATVQIGGTALRIDGGVLKREFASCRSVSSSLLLYSQSLICQVTLTAVCNRHHTVDQQLCRWLLLTQDRIPRGELVVTQEQIAGALGVRRESVTESAGKLQAAGAISYRRGHITVLDRAELQRGSCECYGAVRSEMDRLAAPSIAA